MTRFRRCSSEHDHNPPTAAGRRAHRAGAGRGRAGRDVSSAHRAADCELWRAYGAERADGAYGTGGDSRKCGGDGADWRDGYRGADWARRGVWWSHRTDGRHGTDRTFGDRTYWAVGHGSDGTYWDHWANRSNRHRPNRAAGSRRAHRPDRAFWDRSDGSDGAACHNG